MGKPHENHAKMEVLMGKPHENHRKMEVLMGKPQENHRKMKVYPLVNVYITMENAPCSMGKSTISMVIFKFASC